MITRVVLLCLLAALPAAAIAQQDELALLRNATEKEQAGDFAGSRQVLTTILKQNSQSLSALLALERVLRLEGRLKDLIPYAEAHVKADATSPIGNQMLVRAFSALDQIPDLEKAADTWVRATPKVEIPYREIARVWQLRGEYTKALEYLQLGRQRIGRADALALELGDVYAALEEYNRAVREWERAIGPDARGLLLVQRRLSTLKDGGAQIIPYLVDALAQSPLPARRRAAAQLAIDAGMSLRAGQIVRGTAISLTGLERQSFLVEMARRSDAAQLPKVALWAYSQITPSELNAEQSLAIRARMAELALVLGDTASAARGYKELERSLTVGSPQRRQAVALRIQLMVKEGKLSDAGRDLDAFRAEFANPPELDGVAAALASAYLEKGDAENAASTLAGVRGPRSTIMLGRIALRRGDVAAAKAALLAAAPALRGAEATETIRLVTLLGRVSREGGELLGKAIEKAAAGSAREAFLLLEKGAEVLSETEQAAVLEFAAGLADRSSLPLEAERARRRIIFDYPRSIEAPAALLSLARFLTDRGDAESEARQCLEKLILEYPRSALVPQARQELDRLNGRVPRS